MPGCEERDAWSVKRREKTEWSRIQLPSPAALGVVWGYPGTTLVPSYTHRKPSKVPFSIRQAYSKLACRLRSPGRYGAKDAKGMEIKPSLALSVPFRG